MPPLRRRSEPTNSTPAVNGDNIASLRQKCADVLVSRLQQHAQSQSEANSRQSPEARNIQPSPSESVFSATQLTQLQIQSLVSRSVEQAIAEISSNAARKGFLTAIIDLDQRRPIVIRRVYDANVLREDYLTMDKKKRFSLSLQQHAITSSSRPTVDAAGNANLPSTSTFP